MSFDAFAGLGFPRTAWLEAHQVQTRFRERAAALHPDAGGAADTAAFASLNESASILSDPVRRLRHLLELEGHKCATDGSVDPDLQALGFEVAAVLPAAEAAAQSMALAGSAVAKALAIPRVIEARETCEALLVRLTAVARDVEHALKPERPGVLSLAEIATAANRLVYLRRWERQLREVLLRLGF